MDLKTLRKNRGITQEEAAEIIGLSRRGYQNLEMGKYKKKDSKTLQYALAKLESLPDPNKKKKALSLTSISRAFSDLIQEENVDFAYFLKENNVFVFALAANMGELSLLALEEELSAMISAEVTFMTFDSLLEDKEKALRFLSKARRIYPH